MATRRRYRGPSSRPARRRPAIGRPSVILLAFSATIVVAVGLLGIAWWSQASPNWAEVVRVANTTANRGELLARMDVLAFLNGERATRAETLAGSRDADAVARLRRALDAEDADIVSVAQAELLDELLLRRELGDSVPQPDPAAEVALLLGDDLDRHVRWITLGPGGTATAPAGSWPTPPTDALPDAALVADLETHIRPALQGGDMTDVLAAAAAAGWRTASGDGWAGGEERIDAFDPGFAGVVAAADEPGALRPAVDPSGRISFGQVLELARGTDDGVTRVDEMHAKGISDEAVRRWAWLRAARRAMASRLVDRAATEPGEQVRAEELVIGRSDQGAKGPWVRLAQLAVSRLPAAQGGGDASAAAALAADLNGRPLDDRLARWDALVAVSSTGGGGGTAGGELGFFTREQLAAEVGAAALDPAVGAGAVVGPFTTASGPTLFLVRTRYDGPLDEAAIGALLQVTDAADLPALALQLDPTEALGAQGLAWRTLAEVGPASAAAHALHDTALGRVVGPYVLGGRLYVARPLERRVAIADADQLARIRALGLDAWLDAARGAPDVTVKPDPLARQSSTPSLGSPFSAPPVRTPTLPSIPGAAVPASP